MLQIFCPTLLNEGFGLTQVITVAIKSNVILNDFQNIFNISNC